MAQLISASVIKDIINTCNETFSHNDDFEESVKVILNQFALEPNEGVLSIIIAWCFQRDEPFDGLCAACSKYLFDNYSGELQSVLAHSLKFDREEIEERVILCFQVITDKKLKNGELSCRSLLGRLYERIKQDGLDDADTVSKQINLLVQEEIALAGCNGDIHDLFFTDWLLPAVKRQLKWLMLNQIIQSEEMVYNFKHEANVYASTIYHWMLYGINCIRPTEESLFGQAIEDYQQELQSLSGWVSDVVQGRNPEEGLLLKCLKEFHPSFEWKRNVEFKRCLHPIDSNEVCGRVYQGDNCLGVGGHQFSDDYGQRFVNSAFISNPSAYRDVELYRCLHKEGTTRCRNLFLPSQDKCPQHGQRVSRRIGIYLTYIGSPEIPLAPELFEDDDERITPGKITTTEASEVVWMRKEREKKEAEFIEAVLQSVRGIEKKWLESKGLNLLLWHWIGLEELYGHSDSEKIEQMKKRQWYDFFFIDKELLQVIAVFKPVKVKDGKRQFLSLEYKSLATQLVENREVLSEFGYGGDLPGDTNKDEMNNFIDRIRKTVQRMRDELDNTISRILIKEEL